MVYNRKFLLLHIAVVILIAVLLLVLYPHKKEDLTEKNSVPVYFVKIYGDNEYKLLPVRRKISKGESRLKIAVSELLKGPAANEKNLGYFTEIPEETKLVEIKETPERAVINLSKEFEIGGGSDSMTLRVEQLANTALDSVDEKPVYFEIEGEEVKYIGGEGVMIPQPLSKNLNKGQEI